METDSTLRLDAPLVDQTVRKERKRLFDFIRSRVRNQADAEDILQDVFVQLAASYSLAEPIERMTSWLFTVAQNRIIDWYRRKRPELFATIEEDEPDAPRAFTDLLTDSSQNPDVMYMRTLIWDELMEALDALPEEQRDVFVQHELEGKSFREMAAETGEPINTLLARKRYAVLFIRKRLQPVYEELNF